MERINSKKVLIDVRVLYAFHELSSTLIGGGKVSEGWIHFEDVCGKFNSTRHKKITYASSSIPQTESRKIPENMFGKSGPRKYP